MSESTKSPIGVEIDPNMISGVREAARAVSRIDPKILASAQDMTRAFGPSLRLAASVSESFRGLDLPALKAATKPFESLRFIDLPSFSVIDTRGAFRFARTLDEVGISQLQPRMAEALDALALPKTFTAGVNDALKNLPRAPRVDLATGVESTARKAIALAESSAIREVAAETFVDLEDLSLDERRELGKDVADAIAAIGTVVAILAEDGHVELASASLALVAVLVSIYWRLTGRE